MFFSLLLKTPKSLKKMPLVKQILNTPLIVLKKKLLLNDCLLGQNLNKSKSTSKVKLSYDLDRPERHDF